MPTEYLTPADVSLYWRTTLAAQRTKSFAAARTQWKEKPMPPVTKYDLDRNESEGESLKDQYLRQHGWNYTCDHPGSLWLWVKHINGRTYACDTGTALEIAIEMSGDNDE